MKGSNTKIFLDYRAVQQSQHNFHNLENWKKNWHSKMFSWCCIFHYKYASLNRKTLILHSSNSVLFLHPPLVIPIYVSRFSFHFSLFYIYFIFTRCMGYSLIYTQFFSRRSRIAALFFTTKFIFISVRQYIYFFIIHLTE